MDLAQGQPSGVPLRSIISRFNLSNYVTSPTRVTSHSATLLDLLLSSAPPVGSCETVYLDMSDHFAILAHLHIRVPKHSSSAPTATRRLHLVDWNCFSKYVQRNQQAFPDNGNFEDMITSFTESLLSPLDHHAPLVAQRAHRHLPCPWLTNELVVAVRKRNGLHRKLMRDQGNARLREEHKSARSVARKLDGKLRYQYFTTQCQTTNQRKLWRVLNTVTGRRKKSQIPQAPLPELSRVFGGVVNDPTCPPHLQLPLGPSLQCSLNVFQPVTLTDVESCLKSVDASKAKGSDRIPGFLLKQHASVLAPNLTSIINLSLRTGQVPPTFKVSHVSPLFKSGDPTLPQNYRPVSLLPIISRILETMVKRDSSLPIWRHTSYCPTAGFLIASNIQLRMHLC